ncbi:hypothetical protein [Pontibacter ruber]|uniref:Uncharacterized protein n=1 Tax=Pontibacter ruber TaxID=1343895 RepID=A0ABW5CSZ2_9BACT|nr:hypothetical protein [Pontibacter ruber]
MKYEVTTTKDLQQPTQSVKSLPQNRWVMSGNVVELNRKIVQSEEADTVTKTTSSNELPLRRKSWIPWPKF